ncbi:phage antirepressor KilAC domain-containing protein [Paenibacillus larvae]|uniref:Antirepressor n=9 Tax=root TaxID=1 RepID=A0A0C5AF16_9CAUD|nr:phage antirepressor KilAC domain-containing protein [Paenibacillus larvae]YP_009224904.1 anti-repressor Ant [Paenibacillus phage Rani]YP_009836593.1 anti-repressor Ant [Paenibacillus phage Leyra]YP_009838809.1 anti-repressor Ant [Paenibacillus phage Lucielle]AJK27897.1 antirepressor [Bacteriophage Redbud]AUS03661.1 antirepressor [Paenibacillus phage Kiel007]AXF40478.1 antirepressor [Paenibacillus phage Saudage]QVV19380.1 antirepressor [Paenibacillus phage AlexiD]QVV19781.1 antirepressor 
MNQLQVFNFTGKDVRMIMKGGQPWFVLKDVCSILELSNPRMVKERLSDDVSSTYSIPDSLGRLQPTTIINEDGLYDVILESRKSEAREFRKWVTRDVLPSIRKTGMYAADELLDNPELLIHVVTKLKEEREARQQLEAQVKSDKPKVLFADAVSASQTSILVGDLAKILKQNGVKTGGKRLFEWMRANGYLIKRQGADYNMPTQRAMEMGLFEIKETSVTHSDGHVTINKTSKVTGKGQVYFVNKFKEGETA